MQSNLKIGQKVKVISDAKEARAWKGRIGTYQHHDENYGLPYEVGFDNGESAYFKSGEIESVLSENKKD
jgi:hypothetical protein